MWMWQSAALVGSLWPVGVADAVAGTAPSMAVAPVRHTKVRRETGMVVLLEGRKGRWSAPRAVGHLFLADGAEVFAHPLGGVGAASGEEQVGDFDVLPAADERAVAFEGTAVLDEAPEVVDAAKAVDEERVAAALHDRLVERAVQGEQFCVAHLVDSAVGQLLLLGADLLDGSPVEDERRFKDRGRFVDQPVAVAVGV